VLSLLDDVVRIQHIARSTTTYARETTRATAARTGLISVMGRRRFTTGVTFLRHATGHHTAHPFFYSSRMGLCLCHRACYQCDTELFTQH